ncbi:hypothetical protein PIB30_037191 [Stylosanthes scabra]|uniref:PAS domain-containing protein n=1 Tax=Stylosanthes scabra TaxID=79078 RepID=A0ABU6WDL8_9FABA|nr:hypothetical protein [Stylosanthes scabra]
MLLWNSEAVMLVGKSAREVMNSISGQAALSYPKIFEEILEKKCLMKLSEEAEQSVSNGLVTFGSAGGEADLAASEAVSLSKNQQVRAIVEMV